MRDSLRHRSADWVLMNNPAAGFGVETGSKRITGQAGHDGPPNCTGFFRPSNSRFLAKPRFCQEAIGKGQGGHFQRSIRK